MAFYLFGMFGHRLTPYRCHASLPAPDVVRVRKSCGGWHLTRQTRHLLPPAKC